MIEGTSIRIVDSTDETVPIQILFHVDSATLEEESEGVLDALAMFLNENPDLNLVEVQGHSDERGSPEYNLELSRRRAETVVTYLGKRGIAPDRLRSKAFGSARPIAKGTNETAWGRNRRVEFVILGR